MLKVLNVVNGTVVVFILVQRKTKMDTEESIREQEATILQLGSLYSKHGKAEGNYILV